MYQTCWYRFPDCHELHLSVLKESIQICGRFTLPTEYVLEGDFAVRKFDPNIATMFCTDCELASVILNEMKYKVLRFNPLKTCFQVPVPFFQPVNREKILGITFSTYCKFNSHVIELVCKGYAVIQSLITIKRFGFRGMSMKLVYITYTFCLEYAYSTRTRYALNTRLIRVLEKTYPVWRPNVHLSSGLSQDIEAIKIRACKVMMGES